MRKKIGIIRLISLFSGIYFWLFTGITAYANPQGPQVVHGQAGFSNPNPNTLNVTNSPNAIINWKDFSIKQHEVTRFIQQSGNSAVLNRVTGGNPSNLLGQLLSNGKVFLINPNGMVFGPNCVIDTAGFVASTLNITDQDFLQGNLKFEGGSDSGSIINQGYITAGKNGDIYLIAPNIENSGIIHTEGGNLLLAAGESITITSLDLKNLHFEIQAPENEVLNLGRVLADGGAVNVFAGTLKHSGEIRADTVDVDQTGTIILSASSVVTDGEISATGDTGSGGDIIIKGSSWVSLGNTVDAGGESGGTISVDACGLSIAAPVLAMGTTGQGGNITLLTAGKSIETVDTLVDVSGAAGGTISHIAGQQITTSGTYLAMGMDGTGGNIDLTAPATKLLSPEFDVSGKTDGGRVRIGGEFQGGKDLNVDEIPNARILAATDATRITADSAGTDGKGGEVIVWADQETVFLGKITALPGNETGEGGFVEVSSGDQLTFRGDVVTGVDERKGTFLLDPKNIIIADSQYSQYGIVLGYNYADVPGLTATVEAGDEFGYGLSLDGTRLAVGAPGDDGAFGSVGSNSGAVHLFTFTDSTFSGARLAGTIGRGYIGGKNIDVASLDSGDNLGFSVSLDGTRLAAGARYDDGWDGTSANAGAVHLFSFTDSNFSGGVHEATLGLGYSPANTGNAKSRDVSGLDAGDQFGSGISLSGNYLAAGAWLDDGNSDTVTDSGAVRLFSFTDSVFNGATQHAVLGADYGVLGAPNLSVAGVGNFEWFGTSVSLDGDSRLSVGSAGDDSGGADTGAVYLFTFTPGTNFTGGTLEGTMGEGLSIPVSVLDNSDFFGSAVSLEGTRLAVGAFGDDGFGVGSQHPEGEGAVHLFSFATSDFTGAVHEGTIGMGYAGAKDIDIGTPGAQDRFGSAVSLDGTRLAVGAMWDDGNSDGATDSGALYLFTFDDPDFSGGALQGIMGPGYTRNKDINVGLEADDYFGRSVSLDGTRLAVGAYYDDGADNATNHAGSVRLYTFADSAFNGAVLESTIGKGYAGGKNFDVAALENNDLFGIGVSISGGRLAVGANGDDGYDGLTGGSGAVYLFTFSDTAFSNPALVSTIGKGYDPGTTGNSEDFDLTALEAADLFGTALSLDDLRLAVGALEDSGQDNSTADAGAVYLFTFDNLSFSNPALQATIGKGYDPGTTGNPKDLDLSVLEPSDKFGISVSLDTSGSEARLAAGAWQDDGSGNSVGDSGAAYLFSFSDLVFSDPTLEATIGKGYTGGKNFDLAALGSSDYAGTSISLDGQRLAIGAYGDDGAVFTSAAGAVHLFSFTGDYSGLVLESTIGKGYTGGKNFDVAQLEATDRFGYSVSLDGNRLAAGAVGDDGAANNRSFAGGVYLFAFDDETFNGATLAGTVGYGYTGVKSKDLGPALDNDDQFGLSVSLDGNRLAVGALQDDGAGNLFTDTGAVHLFTFADMDFNAPVLEATIGKGYTGGKNLDLSVLESFDKFGTSVSISGNGLAVGAYFDDGAGNALANSGAVYMFLFSDNAFSNPTLVGTIGSGYGYYDMTGLDAEDHFGVSVSLDDTRLAVGSVWDDGASGGSTDDFGAVYLFTDSFTSPVLQATTGKGYTGGKNLNVSTLDIEDYFGWSVSLDDNRLAVGAHKGDGFLDNRENSGEVHLFTFTDNEFSGAALVGTIGYGHPYYDMDSLDAGTFGDYFGHGVAIEDNRLAVGTLRDDGLGNTVTDAGAVHVFSFSDSQFADPVLEGTIGRGYSGYDLTVLETDDRFGTSVSLDDSRLAVGAFFDDGFANAASNSGAVYFFDLGPVIDLNSVTFGTDAGLDYTITSLSLENLLISQNVILQANNDIQVLTPVDVMAGGAGGDLTLQAGRSILVQENIYTDGGAFFAFANSTAADGVVNTERDAGAAEFTLLDGHNISTGGGEILLELKDGEGLTNNTSGNLTIGDGSMVNSNGGPVSLIVHGSGIVLTDSGIGASVQSFNGDVLFQGDNMDLQGNSAIDAGSGDVILQPFNIDTDVEIDATGIDGPGVLRFSPAELGTITNASILEIGRSDATAGALSLLTVLNSSDINATELSLAHRDIAISEGIDFTSDNEHLSLTAWNETKVFNNSTVSNQHVSINTGGDFGVDGLNTGIFIMEGGSTVSNTDTIISADNIKLYDLGSGSPSVQVLGGTAADSEVHLQAMGNMNISAADGILVSSGGTGSWAEISSNAGQTITAKYIEVISGAGGADALIWNTGGIQEIVTTGDNGSSRGIAVEAAGSGSAMIISEDDQDIDIENGYNLSVLASSPVSYAQIWSQDYQEIELTDGGAIEVGSAAAQGESELRADIDQYLSADQITVQAGSADNADARIFSDGTQTVEVDSEIEVIGGSAPTGPNGTYSRISSEDLQIITANSIKIWFDTVTGGENNEAHIGSESGQQLQIGSGGILVQAGTSSTAGTATPGNRASIYQMDPGNTQTITIASGGDFVIRGGDGLQDDWSLVQNQGPTSTVTLDGGNLIIEGSASPLIVYAATTPSAALYSEDTLNLNVTGDVDLDGGAGTDSVAGVYGMETLDADIDGNLYLNGGTGVRSSAGFVGNSVVLDVTGSVEIEGGSNTDSFATIIGKADANPATIVLGDSAPIGGDILLTGGTATGSSAIIGNAGVYGTFDVDITIDADGSLELDGGTGGSFVGPETAGGDMNIETVGDIDVRAGPALDAFAFIRGDNQFIESTSGNIQVHGGQGITGDDADASIWNLSGTQTIVAAGDIKIFGGDSSAGNISEIASEGSQNINAGNDILVQAGGGLGGDQNSAAIVAGEGGVGDQTITVGNNLHVIGGSSSGWNNWARVGTTGGLQDITATGQLLVQGSNNGDNNLATVDADTGQDIQANDIHVIAGAGGNMNEAEIECRLGGTQDIEALNELKVQGGAGGDNNKARIALENTGAAQIISAGAGGIMVLGGSNVATSLGNSAEIINDVAGATQTLNLSGGGDLLVQGGNGVKNNYAKVTNNGGTLLTIKNQTPGSDIILQGGGDAFSAGNYAEIISEDLLVDISGNVDLTGGSGFGARASIEAHNNLTMIFDSGTLTGGGNNNAFAFFTTYTAGTNMDVDVLNNLTIVGGTGGNNASAGLFSEFGPIDLDVANDLTIQGGSGGTGAYAGVEGPDLVVDVGGKILLQGGSGTEGFAYIGADYIDTVVIIGSTTSPNEIEIKGGTGTDAIALIGAVGAGHDADVTINGGGSVNLFGGGGGALIGTSTDHGDITIKTGLLGSGDLILDYGEILTADDIELDVAGLLGLKGGTAINQASRIRSNTGILTVNADALEQIAGSGDFAEARLEAATGITLDINGNALAQAGSGDHSDAEIISLAGTLDIDIDGSFTILGGAGFDANAGPGAEGSGTLLLGVTGNLILTGGSNSNANAGAGGSGGGGTVDLNVGGDLILTGGSNGSDASANIGGGVAIIDMDIGGDLQMTGGNDGAAFLGSGTEDVSITIGVANPVGGDISISGGSGANAVAAIGAGGAHNADVTIETNGSFTMNARTGGTLIGSELAGGLVDIKAGLGGAGGIALNDGTIHVDDDVMLQATAPGGTITQNAAGIINIGTNTLTADADGDIILLGTNTMGEFVPSSANGNVDYQHQGALSIDSPIGGVSGDMTFRATGGISQTAPVSNVNTLNLFSGGVINMDNAGNAVTVLNATDSSGTGILFQNNGDLNVGLLDAGPGTVTLKVTGAGNSLTDANGGATNVIGASGVTLEAPVNIGTLGDPIEIQTSSLTLQGTHTGEVAIANTGNLVFGGGAGMSDLLLTTTGTLNLTGPIGSGMENLGVRANGFDLSGFPVNGANVTLSGGSGTLDINSTSVQCSYVELAGSQILIRQGFAPPAQVTSTGEMYIHGGGLVVDSADVRSNTDMTLQTSSVTLQANGTSNALVKAGGDMTVSTGSLKVVGSNTSASLSSKLEASGNMDITADSVTVQGGDLSNTFASIDPYILVMNVSGDVNVLGGAGDGSYAEISGEIVEINAGPTLGAGNINITGGTGNNAGAWIESTCGDITLVAGDILFPADINLTGGAGINSDSLIDAAGGVFDVYLTFHNGVGLTLLPGLTPATDVGILALCLCLNSYDPFYQPPVDPISDIVSSQSQMDELLDEVMDTPGDLTVTGDGTGDEEEDEEKKRGRLICK